MKSSLYLGDLYHGRLTPVVNRFRYSLFMVLLDLGELETVFDGRWFWSVERFNLASFRRADHLRRSGPLPEAVREVVREQLGQAPSGPIRLLTHLRYWGYCFNPLSVYYCFGDDGTSIEAVLVEVHNTPWGEEYLRAFDPRRCRWEGDSVALDVDKEFHVSPFLPLDMRYRWRFSPPGERLAIGMENYRDGEKVLEVALRLKRAPLDGPHMARALLRWPFMTGKVIAAIYWQALRLKAKGVSYHPHPAKTLPTRGTVHP